MSRELKCAELSGWVDLTYLRLPKGRVSNMAKKDIYVWDLHFFLLLSSLKCMRRRMLAQVKHLHICKNPGFFGPGTYICQNVSI